MQVPPAALARRTGAGRVQAFLRSQRADGVFRWLTLAAGVLILLILLAMALGMVRAAGPSIDRTGWRFLVRAEWDPVAEEFGAAAFVVGTLASSALALVLAGPPGLGVAIWLAEVAPARLREPVSFLVELLAAVPSVVYGLWGIFVLAPWLRDHVQVPLSEHLGFVPLFSGPPLGVGLMAGGVVLAIMIVPTITAVSREVLRAVPDSLREGALAMGSTRWEMIRLVLLPAARPGIMGAIILGLGRALGETMAVTMVIGNRAEIPRSLLSPAQTMASVIANEFAEAVGDVHLAALVEVGLVLFGVTLLVGIGARVLIWSVTRGRSLGGGVL